MSNGERIVGFSGVRRLVGALGRLGASRESKAVTSHRTPKAAAMALLFAAPLLAEELSFELDGKDAAKPKDRTHTVSSVDDLALVGITGKGVREVARAVTEALKDKPKGTKARITVGIATEGSVRWTYYYPRSAVALDEQGRPHGTEFLAIKVVYTVGRITIYRHIPWKHGVRHGLEREFRRKDMWKPDAHVAAEIPWKDGKMHGAQKTLLPNGKVQTETVYVNGIANGPTRIWDEEGNLTSEGLMKNGKLDGRFVEYWPGTKQAKRTIHYQMGVTHGPVTEYYRSGKLKRKRAFRNEAAHGEDRLYNEDGTIAKARYWLDGNPVTKREFEKRSKQ